MLNRVADLLEIKGENFFKIRAYREAVRQLDNLTTEVEELIHEGKLKDVPGIGAAIEQKIDEYVTTGQLEFLARLEAEIPPALLELTRVPGLGPRTAKDVYDTLGILSLEELEAAALSHRLLQVRGIKARTEENILKAIAQLKRTESRIFFPEAWILADSFLATLRALPGVVRAEITGSARRARETVRDLDLLVASNDPEATGSEFARLPQLNEVIAQAPTAITIRVRSGMQVDLRAVKPEGYGAAWQHLTGAPAHLAQLQARAELPGKRIDEAGVVPAVGRRLADGSLDLPDDCLASLDVVVASVHTALDQPKDVITQRVLSALRSPHVDVLAHPTSRRLDRRGETSLDIDAVIAEAVKTGTALEINSSPWRLDLNDSWARKAREAGAMLAIDTDAHYPAEFDSVRYGCAIARRAGLTPDRILNARDVDGLLAHCQAKAARAVANFR